MTTPHNDTVQNEWYQFDPNVHYYYDEQGQVQYYDPNATAVDYSYDQQQNNTYYNNQQQQQQQQQHQQQAYTPSALQQQNVNSFYADTIPRQPTPEETLLPCPEPSCKGENKPTSKFCEECGRPLGPISRSVTPATDYLATPNQYDSVHQYQQQPDSSTDPLERARGCPIVTFGFGGKMLVTFPRSVANYYSSIVKPQPGLIQIKHLKDFKLSVDGNHQPQFPGPILFDPKVGTKQKKKEVGNYIIQMVDEFEKQKLSIVFDSVEYHKLESKILLWQLVKVMVENDGYINDKDKMDQAILSIIRPKMNSNVEESHFSLPSYQTENGIQRESNEVEEEDLSDYMLSKIEHYLLNGDRVEAVNYAIQEDLWAHALIISSCVNKELWQKVISNFVDREMNATPDMRRNRKFNNIAGNNQALRVMYSLFSGAGGAAMKEFIVSDIQHVHTPYGLQTVTPPVDVSQLVRWRHTLAIILANRTVRDLEALTALGDILKEQGWIEAAHVCYLLSPQSSIHSGYDTVNVRMTLVGSENPSLEAYQLTEIFEFANSLHNPNTATCLPFLQGYKLAHAWAFADDGSIDIAQRYYGAIDQCIKSYTKGNSYLHSHLTQQVTALGAFLENARGKKTG
ncbi:MAG: Sec23-binding domain of Sec16-domain-containing protein [Benjaminiella poitrasii]|nr:MAG: Sec23-binding domain of Sec16-domain-containing protein [Benjaminiella poitrasii]